jgi:ABC-type multidrug transport system ATPase subunit
VLFLDEPTTGVDAVSRKEFWDMLKRLKEQDITILVSTPYMDEATLCDRIALIQTGKILAIDTPANIVKAYSGNLYEVKSDTMHKLPADLRNFENTLSCFAFGEYMHITFKNEKTDNSPSLLNYLSDKGHSGIELKQVEPTIEDCFIKLLKQ